MGAQQSPGSCHLGLGGDRKDVWRESDLQLQLHQPRKSRSC